MLSTMLRPPHWGFSIFLCFPSMELTLVAFLRAAWIAGTLPVLIASIPSSRLNSFHGLVLGLARRGKIMPSSSYKWTVPKSFFCHFYLVAVVWTTFLVLVTWLYAYRMAPLTSEPLLYSTVASHLTGGSHTFSFHKHRSAPLEQRYLIWRSVFLLLLMEVHVMRRLYETIYVFNYNRSARMHVFGYLTGLFFYIAAPLSLCCCCAPEVFKFAANQSKEFIVKGKNQMLAIEFNWWGYMNSLMKLGWSSWLGAAIFGWGWIHQHHCHAILGEQEGEYVILHGDWFEMVSSPHYLAEIVIYGGLLVASRGSDLTIWLLFGFVASNLIFAAAETHRWYLQKFDSYPSNRFAIIPFVY